MNPVTFLFTPAFCKASMLQDLLAHLYGPLPEIRPAARAMKHVVIDNHYPVQKDLNREQIRALAESYGCIYVNSGRDLGLHEGINAAAKVVGIRPCDRFVGCDPDDRPAPGFVQAITEVMDADPDLAVLGCSFWVIPWRRDQGVAFEEKVIAGRRVWIHPGVEMWNVAGFNWRFMTEIGGFRQPNAYYGGLEACLFPEWQRRGLKLGYLPDFRSDVVKLDQNDTRLFDPEYRRWKDDHVAGFKGGFEEWLRRNAPHKL